MMPLDIATSIKTRDIHSLRSYEHFGVILSLKMDHDAGLLGTRPSFLLTTRA